MAETFWFDGKWTDEAPKLIGPADHAFWLASVTFDGARAIHRRVPDLDRHMQRAIRSAKNFGLEPTIDAPALIRLAGEGIRRFGPDAELYIKPVFYGAGAGHHLSDTTTQFTLHIFEAPLPSNGFSATMSPLRRPAPTVAPTNAKAACLYPNSDRATREARSRGFDEAVMRDLNDNIAEFAFANIMMAKDGKVFTPQDNGCYLAGITRKRILQLLNDAGVSASEKRLTVADLQDADEIWETGNFAKITPCTRFEDRSLNAGPLYAKARKLYFDWAETVRLD